MKIAIYCRTSKFEQNPVNQELVLVEYAKRMNWDYEVFKEQESTRKTRPIQYNLYQRLLRKEFDGVLVHRIDRWARSLRELVLHIEEFESRKVMFVSLMDNIDLSSATGRLMFHIISAFAEFERNIIRERTLAGLARAKAQGKRLGRHPKKCQCKVCKNRRGK